MNLICINQIFIYQIKINLTPLGADLAGVENLRSTR